MLFLCATRGPDGLLRQRHNEAPLDQWRQGGAGCWMGPKCGKHTQDETLTHSSLKRAALAMLRYSGSWAHSHRDTKYLQMPGVLWGFGFSFLNEEKVHSGMRSFFHQRHPPFMIHCLEMSCLGREKRLRFSLQNNTEHMVFIVFWMMIWMLTICQQLLPSCSFLHTAEH